MALSHVVSDILNVEKFRDLEISVKGLSRSSKVVPFNKLQGHDNFIPKTVPKVFEIFDL